ncbi:MAG: Gfo/Idh/MocA family oxidoreductase [Tannerella sp.]|nr:Gfo/Idh/MocA family oxidoreductase [Tannerella sp.]
MITRRKFLTSTGATMASALVSNRLSAYASAPYFRRADSTQEPRLRFGVIGINHAHINSMVGAVIRGGGEFTAFYAKEDDLAAAFAKDFPQAKRVRSEDEILEDKRISLVLSAAIACERAPIGIRAMKHGKDYLADKPGITTLEQLDEVRQVQRETGRIFSILYSERLEHKATVRAGELVRSGVIGKVVQTLGMGPHRMNIPSRPDWFFDKKYYGGIICDIGSHQFDQFLYFTGSTEARILSSQIGNVRYTQYPEFEDFGDATVTGNGGSGYIRVDWFTPDGLDTWGDGRLTILGTEGYIELRKYTDIAGRKGGDHLFLVNDSKTEYVECQHVELPFGRQFVDDILNRTETAMTQHHCFLATELALLAQKNATVVKFTK